MATGRLRLARLPTPKISSKRYIRHGSENKARCTSSCREESAEVESKSDGESDDESDTRKEKETEQQGRETGRRGAGAHNSNNTTTTKLHVVAVHSETSSVERRLITHGHGPMQRRGEFIFFLRLRKLR